MNKIVLKAENRKTVGRKVKNLRNEGKLPANVFGKKVKSASVQVDTKEFEVVYKEAGETGLITLTIGSETRPVLVHSVQLHPVGDYPLHVDFLQVDLKEKVEAEVPVELIGESPAEKQAIGTVVQYVNEVKVEALPADLPDKFEVDTSGLSEVDQAVYVKDLAYDKSKVEIKSDLEAIVAKVEPPQKEEVVEAPAPVEGEAAGPELAEGSPAEGEKPGVASEAPKEEPTK